MKIKMTISALLILLFFSSCDKKPTDPPEDDKYKIARLSALVKDSTGNGVDGAIVSIRLYHLNETIPGLTETFTNEFGRCTIQFPVLNKVGKDTILVHAFDLDSGISSDTITARVEYDGQNFSYTFVLDM